jgi:hypothetical protein
MDQTMASMTPDRSLHVKTDFYNDGWSNTRQVYWHLLKFHEIMDAASGRLPRLQSIELRLHVWGWGEEEMTYIKAVKREDVLQVNQKDVSVGYQHSFEAGDGYEW